jgi:hypothetical protein
MKSFASKKPLQWVSGLALLALLFLFTQAVPQDPAYYLFADGRAMLYVPNFWNVISNLPFLFIGIWGLLVTSKLAQVDSGFELKSAYMVFFIGVFLTAFGSSYFHYEPGDETLFWDRLPMTIAFAGLFAAVIGEYVSVPAARRWLLPFLLIGISSVLYWQWTESIGAGDLRPYAIVQFLPMLAVPAILLISKRENDIGRYIWLMIFFYLIAKVLEQFDAGVYEGIHIMSGHALKHLAAAVAPAMLALGLRRRESRRTPVETLPG